MAFKWWQTGVIYQIYPRSFKDSNGDGIGDLPGIVSKLDYLKWLGVQTVWLSPIYPSPMKDFGYDVADYTGIEPIFGTMEDFDHLLDEIHRREMKLMLDWVPNHTSDEHPWFIESRSSRDNPKRDWYIWRDAKPDGGPPNNWISHFGGSAWEWDATTEQYYLHLFVTGQPDLNWRNPDVKTAMFDTLRFWLDKGVDGFRMDVVTMLMKDPHFRDNPVVPGASPDNQEFIYSVHRPDIHPVMREIRQVIDEYDDRVAIGELYLDPRSHWIKFYGRELDELHMPFNFDLLLRQWSAREMLTSVELLESSLPEGAWPNYVFGNHDQMRVATRFGPEKAHVAAMLLLTLRGTPTIYMGEEIGMPNGEVPDDRIQDPPGLIKGPEYSRDGCRTPFQWSDEEYAGFSTIEPWLPVDESYQLINVEAQKENDHSLLNLYRRLLDERAKTPALNRGDYISVHHVPSSVYTYLREWEDERRLIVLNFADHNQVVGLDHIAEEAEVILSTMPNREGTESLLQLPLRPNEGLILKI